MFLFQTFRRERERRSPGIFSLNRDKIKEEEQYQARLFSWQHHSAGTKRGKKKKDFERELEDTRAETKTKEEKRQITSSTAAAASHRHTRSSILLYARLLSKKKKSLPPPPRPSPRLVVEGVARSFRNEVTFRVAAQHTHKPQQQQPATAGIIFLFCFVLSLQKNVSSHLVSLVSTYLSTYSSLLSSSRAFGVLLRDIIAAGSSRSATK